MDWAKLDSDISDLEGLIEMGIGFDTEYRLKCIFDRCQEIQEGFNSKPRYPTREQREAVWVRFNGLRSKAFNMRNENRGQDSGKLCGELLRELGHADYNLGHIIAENTFLFFDKADTAEMKQKGEILSGVRQRLRENKGVLTHEHHQEIWSRILQVQSNLDAWWGKWKAQKEQRDAEWQAKAKRHDEWKEKKEAWEERVKENLRKNGEKLEKAEGALAKAQAHAEELREKVESAWNDTFKSRASEWLDQEEERIKSIEEHVQRLKNWIEEDEKKLEG